MTTRTTAAATPAAAPPSSSTTANSINSTKQNSSNEFQVPAVLLEEISYYEFAPLESEQFQPNCDAENPFAAVTRADRLMGKLIDWTTGGMTSGTGKLTFSRRRGSVADEKDDEAVLDDWSLVMVEPKSASVPGVGRRGSKQPFSARRGSRGGKFAGSSYGGRSAPRIHREPSLSVSADWSLVEEIEFSRLAKLQFYPSADPQVVHSAGELKTFDRSLNRTVCVKNETLLGSLDITPTPAKLVLEDAELLRLAKEHGAKIVTSDVAVTALMACSRSQLPWDVQVWQDGESGLVIIDKREAFTQLDFPFICENADEPPVHDKDHINGASNLAEEASRINAKLPHVLSSGSQDGESDRYVLWDLGEDLKVLVRCRVNYNDGANVGVLLALLEYEPGRTGNWRSRLDTQRAAIVANEAKDNAAVLSRWLLGAILANVAVFKLAFVSRIFPRERTKHALLGLHEAEPFDAAFQLGIDVANGFGILKALGKQLLELCNSSSNANGSFVLMRDPNKPLLRLYSSPHPHAP